MFDKEFQQEMGKAMAKGLKSALPSNYITVVEEGAGGQERVYDLESKLMQNNIIIISGQVDGFLEDRILKQVMYLDSIQDNNDIMVYLNSPGGSILDGLAIQNIFDSAQKDVQVIGRGLQASMGSFFISNGHPGKRLMYADSYVMAHQAKCGSQGDIQDVNVSTEFSNRLNEKLCKRIASRVGMDYDEYMPYVERDMWFNAKEALLFGKYGFCDGIIMPERDPKTGENIILTRETIESSDYLF